MRTKTLGIENLERREVFSGVPGLESGLTHDPVFEDWASVQEVAPHPASCHGALVMAMHDFLTVDKTLLVGNDGVQTGGIEFEIAFAESRTGNFLLGIFPR